MRDWVGYVGVACIILAFILRIYVHDNVIDYIWSPRSKKVGCAIVVLIVVGVLLMGVWLLPPQ